MFILTDLTNIYVLESISSRIETYFSSILYLWNHTMCLCCFALTCKLKWDFDYNSSCFQRVGVAKRSCYNQHLILVCTLKQSSGGTSCGFTNIQSNWNMFRSDWKSSPVHTYCLNQSKWTVSTSITEGCVMFSQGGRMGYPACILVLGWSCDWFSVTWKVDGLVQDCSIASVFAIEILQSCTKPPIKLKQ